MSSVQREWFDKDYYAILGVPVNADQKSITRAYRRLAREFHPDANPGDSVAEERFKEVAGAYDVLGDEVKRSEYDQIRSSASAGGFTPGGFSSGGSAFGASFSTEDLGGLFGNLFGGGSAGRPPGPRRGDDMEASIGVSFIESLEGVLMELTLTSEVLCPVCGGSGCAPGTGRTVCVPCGGEGTSVKNQGVFSFAKPCAACGGRGNIPQEPCGTCKGAGVARVPREVKVRVPPGVKDGQKIRLKGLGSPGSYGAPAGDLYVTVSVAADRLFKREGDNILLTLPVTFVEAALGRSVEIPAPGGGRVKIGVPAGSASGSTLRVKGRGVKGVRGKPDGDMLVKLQIVTPKSLTDEQREFLEKMSEVFVEDPRSHL